MNLWLHRYRAWIVPYAEGTLDARRRAQLEARLARDPVLAAEAEAERRVVIRLRAAAQAAGSPPDGKNLWPGIQSRLEARRSPVRPLFLVGGLSAAATSLAWITLWGPSHRSSQPAVAVVASPTAANVIVVGPMPGHHHGHPAHRFRQGAEHLARRQTPTFSRPGYGNEAPTPPDPSRMAHDDTSLPTGEGAEAPPSVSPGPARFHLATSVQPVGHGETSTVQESAAAPGDGTTLSVGSDAEAMDKAVGKAAPVAVDAPVQPEHAPMTHHAHRRHRRHSSRSRGVKPPADAPTETADIGGNTVSSVAGPPARPKSAHKPID